MRTGAIALRKAPGAGLDRDRAERRWPQRRLEPAGRDAAREAPQRLVLRHADHRIVVAGHADVGDEAGAARRGCGVGARHMGVGADDKARPAVDEMAERLFLARRLGVEVDDRSRRSLSPSGQAASSRSSAAKGSSSASMKMRPIRLMTRSARAASRFDHRRAAARRALRIIGGADQARLRAR